MLDEYFHRDDIRKFIVELKSNPRYLELGIHEDSLYGKCMKNELALYLFYDTIIKYKILIDDSSLFKDFLNQVEKLFRKIVDYDDIVYGINKIISNFISTILDIHDINSEEGREKIIKYIYDKYIINGYFIHGFNTLYEDSLINNNFITEQYNNNYPEMLEVKNIFKKYNINIMDKDFINKNVFFTDDIVMGCYYSVTSPGYFYQLLFNEHVYGDGLLNRAYLENDYDNSIFNIKKFISKKFREKDKKKIFDIVSKNWKLLHKVPRKVSLLFVKRNKIMNVTNDKLNEYLNSTLSTKEIINRLLSSSYRYIEYSGTLNRNDYEIVSLDDFYSGNDRIIDKNSSNKMNSSGMISLCLIVGSLLITMGVIISIILVLRGI